jgi:tetratricopeptide (TPR) repeat protein
MKDSEKVEPLQSGEYENLKEGESIITGGAQFQNQDAENIYWTGIDQIKAGNKSDALESFNKALNIEPKNLTILESTANLKGECGEFSDSIKIFQKIISIDSTRYSTYLNLGLTYFFNGDFINSHKQFDIVILNSEESEEKGIAHFHKSEIFLEMNECTNANKSLDFADTMLTSETLRIHIEGLRNNIKNNCC